MTHVLVEGGSELNAALLKDGLINEVRLYVAPKLLGGRQSTGVIGGASPRSLAQAVPLVTVDARRLGTDLVVEGRL